MMGGWGWGWGLGVRGLGLNKHLQCAACLKHRLLPSSLLLLNMHALTPPCVQEATERWRERIASDGAAWETARAELMQRKRDALAKKREAQAGAAAALRAKQADLIRRVCGERGEEATGKEPGDEVGAMGNEEGNEEGAEGEDRESSDGGGGGSERPVRTLEGAGSTDSVL